MNKTEKQAFFNRAVSEAALEILGAAETQGIFPPEEKADGGNQEITTPLILINQIGNEFSIRYHRKTAQGLLLRIGEAAFSILRKRVQELQDLGALENRLQPARKRFTSNTKCLAKILSEYTGLVITSMQIEQDKYCLSFKEGHLDSANDLFSYFFLGLLRAYGTWMDSRKDYFLEVAMNEHDQNQSRVCFTIADFE